MLDLDYSFIVSVRSSDNHTLLGACRCIIAGKDGAGRSYETPKYNIPHAKHQHLQFQIFCSIYTIPEKLIDARKSQKTATGSFIVPSIQHRVYENTKMSLTAEGPWRRSLWIYRAKRAAAQEKKQLKSTQAKSSCSYTSIT